MTFTKLASGVYVPTSSEQPLSSQEMGDFVLGQAKKNVRGVARICLHSSTNDSIQLMVIGLAPNHQFPVHRHLMKDEWLIHMDGAGVFRFHSEEGTSETESTHAFLKQEVVTVAKGRWHSIESLDSGLAFTEVAPGPFNPADTIYRDNDVR